MMEAISGTYALIMRSHSWTNIRVGRWGNLNIHPGYYVYIGSAFGPGGVKARVERHWRESKRMHWHVDFLRKHVVPVCVWFCYGNRDVEHQWASICSKLDGFLAIEGFGSSDCQCLSHLFSSIKNPDFSLFRTKHDFEIFCLSYVETG